MSTFSESACWQSSGWILYRSLQVPVLQPTSATSYSSWPITINRRERRHGMSSLVIDVIAHATRMDCTSEELVVSLNDGRVISVPLAWLPRLARAKPEPLSRFELLGDGEGIHGSGLDEDISVYRSFRRKKVGGVPRTENLTKRWRALGARRDLRPLRRQLSLRDGRRLTCRIESRSIPIVGLPAQTRPGSTRQRRQPRDNTACRKRPDTPD